MELRMLPVTPSNAAPRRALLLTAVLAAACASAGAAPQAAGKGLPPAQASPGRTDALPGAPCSSSGASGCVAGSESAGAKDRLSWAPPRAGSRHVGDLPELASGTHPIQLPAETTVLHIGDSFAGALGIALNAELDRHGVRGVLRYETATYIPTWAHRPALAQMLAQYRPDLVLITLGANELDMPDPEVRAPTIRRLVRRLGGRPCVWIAPPLWKQEFRLIEVIRANIAPCRLMDTNALIPTMERMRDGIHPTMPARKLWARQVVQWLARVRKGDAERPWALWPEL